MKLSREDWQKLDALLSKIGFGGYYDLIELLRMTAHNLAAGEDMHSWISANTDLRDLAMAVHTLSVNAKEGRR